MALMRDIPLGFPGPLRSNCVDTEPPLCVDLDGTLIHSDILHECFAALIRSQPLKLFLIPFWMQRGKAFLKSQLAYSASLNISSLPYNQELINWLKLEKLTGRQLVLATAANETVAFAVNSHLGLFDKIIASPPFDNIKGRAKLAAIHAEIGVMFDYVGDSAADRPIFNESRKAILVTSFSRVRESSKRRLLRSLVAQMRLHQWIKNVLIFLPLISAHQIGRFDFWAEGLMAFGAFSLTASSVYLLNDIVDLEADRNHPQKRRRPFASGELPLGVGFALVPLLLVSGIGASFLVNTKCGVLTLSYYLLTLAYTFRAKRLMLYDVFTLAFLYIARLLVGQAAYHINVSTWLVSCCFFLFLSLALCKRTAELVTKVQLRTTGKDESEQIGGRDYSVQDLPILSCFGVVSGMLASLITVLYVESDNVRKLYRHPEVLWLLSPLLLHWVAKIWLLGHRGMIIEDPVLFSLKERGTWMTLILGAIVLIAASL
jgi:4-hydroxybenzoate polyprenyltransferase